MKKYILIFISLLFCTIVLSSCEKSEDFEEHLLLSTQNATGDGTNGGSQG